MKSRTRIDALDGLRGIAALQVLLYHGFSWTMGVDGWHGLGFVASRLTAHGWLGVDLFFVLSGFLITGVLLDRRDEPRFYATFFVRRALRILPLHVLCLASLVLFDHGAWRFAFASLFYLANIVPLLGTPSRYGPLWSLAVEEHFYLAWPFIVRHATRPRLAAIAWTICLVEPLARALSFAHGLDVYPYTWVRLDELAAGALAAVHVRNGVARRDTLRIAVTLCAAAIVLALVGLPFGIRTRTTIVGAALQFCPFYMIFAATILACVVDRPRMLVGALGWRPLRRAGDYSYFVYLFHELGFMVFDAHVRMQHAFRHIVLRFVVVSGVTFTAAALSYRFIEQPLLRRKPRSDSV